jgi:hypothetical protein
MLMKCLTHSGEGLKLQIPGKHNFWSLRNPKHIVFIEMIPYVI